MAKAILLLSGGLDSATSLYMIRRQADEIYCLTMVYADSFDAEAEASKKLAAAARVKEHIVVLLPFFKDIDRRYSAPPSTRISSAYVPARNIVFYGVATAYAETLNADSIVFGSNADDAKELPDADPSFVQLVNKLIKTGTRAGREGAGIEVSIPLINHSKRRVLELALELKVPLELTWSCYGNGKYPCLKCRGCSMRRQAFDLVGVSDPLLSNLNATD